MKAYLAGVALLALGGSAALFAQGTDAPTLAADAAQAAREAWVARYVDKGAYQITDVDADRVYLYDPASFTRQPDGHVVGTIRAELFRPRTVGTVTVRSVRKRAEIDCATLRYRELTVEGFAGANLTRPVSGLPVSDRWTDAATAGSPAGRRLFPACLDVAGFAKERAMRFAGVKAASPPQEPTIADINARTAAMVAAAGPIGAVDRPPVIWRTSDKPVVVFDVPVGPRLVVVPAGEMTLGEGAARRRVRFDRALAVGMFPITYGEYSWFVAETRRATPGACRTLEGGSFAARPGRDWYFPGAPQVGRSPAACVGYDDAVAYTEWLSARTGQHYRLLTDAEYEYANRAGTTTAYWWGGDIAGGCAIANGFDQDAKANAPSLTPSACHDGQAFSGPLDRPTKPNAFGLFDTTGNLASWTSDCWTRTRAACSVRSVRGGSWASPPDGLRSAAREGRDAGEAAADIGFRVAREL